MLSGRERETAIFTARIARTREGQPQHTALLGDWAIGKTTLLMHWRRLRQQAGDAVVLTMAYPQPKDEFLGGLAEAVEAGVDTDWRERLDLEIGQSPSRSPPRPSGSMPPSWPRSSSSRADARTTCRGSPTTRSTPVSWA
jgi:hypothetical protein